MGFWRESGDGFTLEGVEPFSLKPGERAIDRSLLNSMSHRPSIMNDPLVRHACFYALLLIPHWILASDEIAPLPPPPKGGIPLVTPADATSVKLTGAPHVSATTTTWNEIPGSLGLQIHSRKAQPNPWNAAVNFPFKAGIASGDVSLLWFYARKSPGFTGTRAGGSVLVGGGQGKDYAKAVSHDFELGTSWSLVLVPFPALQAIPAGQGSVSLHLGEQAQQIDIAGLSLLNFGKRIPLSDLPQPALTYAGREPDAAWRKAALQRIESTRKSDFRIKVVDSNGNTVPGAKVDVDLRRHEFGFGSAVTASWLNRPGPDGAMYREIVDRYFSRVVLESDLKEMGWKKGIADPPDKEFQRERTLRALDWLENRNIEVRGHCLTWGVFDEFTTPLRNDPAALKQHMLDHMSDILPAIGHRVIEWDAINHPASWSPTNRITAVTGPSLYPDLMRHARSLSTVPMWLNEDQVFRPGRQQEDYYQETKALIAAGQAPDGIGIQGHFHCSFLPGPEEMLRISDRFSKLVPKLQITEFDILANGDETLQADWFRDCMIMAFSHPAYTGFQTWGFTERTVLRKEAMPWKADWSERPLANVWKTWVGGYWHSGVRGKTDAAGQFKFRGYHGRYTVAVETTAGRRVTEVLLKPTQLETTIILP
jgi:GH35 family endo-1,4-beta-xylanase